MKQLSLAFCMAWIAYQVNAQNALFNASNLPASSDNTGSALQPGTEVLHSTPGAGVVFTSGGSFEHVGQFYVASDGIWNQAGFDDRSAGTDYFGYAPDEVGTRLPYQGIGIKGASRHNGGTGTGRPTFGHLQLNSTGIFPVTGGMFVSRSLAFDASGPGKGNIITTPNALNAYSAANAVEFSSTAQIKGYSQTNYIDGFASVTHPVAPFTLPIGDGSDAQTPLHPLTVDNSVQGTVIARYQHHLSKAATVLEAGIDWVSPVGHWLIAAPAGTQVTVRVPDLPIQAEEWTSLRLVGWNGSQWITLSHDATTSSCVGSGCPLSGTLVAGVTDLAIGLTKRKPVNGEATQLTLWPNPTRGALTLSLSAGKAASEVRLLDLRGHLLQKPTPVSTSLDVSSLPAGMYVLEVVTTQGQTLKERFIKQ